MHRAIKWPVSTLFHRGRSTLVAPPRPEQTEPAQNLTGPQTAGFVDELEYEVRHLGFVLIGHSHDFGLIREFSIESELYFPVPHGVLGFGAVQPVKRCQSFEVSGTLGETRHRRIPLHVGTVAFPVGEIENDRAPFNR